MQKNKLLIIFSSLIAIYAIIGFVALPKILQPQIQKAINENITQKATLEKIEFNPFLLKFTAHNLKIFDEKETTISVEKLLVDFSIFKSIDEQHISFKDLQLVNPFINVIEYEDGTLNLQKLAKEKKEESKEKKEEESKEKSDIKFQIYRTILDDARIKFTKLSKDEEPFELDINKLNYTFYDMGTFRNTLASHSLRILINNNSELVIKGGVRLDPFKMHGNVELNNFKPKEFLTYKKDMLNFDLSEKSTFDLAFGYRIDTSEKLKIELNNTQFNLRDLDITQKDNSIISLKRLAIEDLNLNYPENNVSIDSIFLDNFNSKIIKDADNKLNLANLIKSEKATKPIENIQNEVTKDKLNNVENKNDEIKTDEDSIAKIEDKELKEEKNNSKPWRVTLNKLLVKNSNVSFDDIKNALFVETKNINIDLSSFKLNGNDFTLDSLSLNKPVIKVNDKKNSLNIVNKDLELTIKELSSKESILTLNSLNLKNSEIAFKDLKNQLNILTSGLNLDLKEFKQNIDEISVKSINLINPKTTFKDNKNKLQIFTKKTSINISDIKKLNEKVDISSLSLKNPSILLRDNKNNLKILTNSLVLDVKAINLNGNNIKIKKSILKTPTLKFNDLKAKMDITTKNINLIATNTSLIKDNLKIAILSLARPSIYLVDNKNDKTIVAKKVSLKINNISKYKNTVNVSKINLFEPNLVFKDNKAKTDILAKNIYLNVQNISHKNNLLKIVRSSINKPYVSITLGKQPKIEKDTNTQDGSIKETNKKTPIKVVKKAKKKGDFKFDIGPVKIKNMKMTFEDKNLPIPFKTNITKLNGEFSRLNSSNSKPTKLSLEGTVDEYGYTKITGTVDINDIKLLTDTNLLFKNIAIKNFTPYSGKFVGREIESGKLNLDLKYNIKKSDLKAQNSVVISDIKFGKNVESPDAVNLPLELAIALLEDSDGVIDLELPVTGNVDDPQFSIAPIVWKVFTNLIIKAITSPFTLLASVFGISEDKIKSLEFELGKSEIIASEKETLDNIAKILSKKPKLAIKINPVYDPENDKIALQDIKFEQFLIKEMDKIPEGDDYKEALEDIYEDIDGVKDIDDVEDSFVKKDKEGKEEFDNDAYVEYLRKFLASRYEVSQSELINLSKKRVDNILKYLTDIKKIPKEAIKVEEVKKQDLAKAKWAVFNLDVATK